MQEPEITAKPQRSTGYKFSRAISVVMHPWIIPSYITAIVLFGDTLMLAIPNFIRTFFLGIVMMDTIFLPAAVVLMLRRFGVMSPLGVQTKRDTLLSIAITGACYLVTLLMVKNIPMAFMIYYIFSAAIVGAIVSLIVSIFYKINLHMVSLGGMVAMLMMFTLSGVGNTMGLMLLAILVSGMVGSARIYLKAATVLQVATGFLCGFSVMFITFQFFI